MRKVLVCVMAVAALSVVPLFAQSGSNETLIALLGEVRLLRQALERNASSPQVQLLGTRLQVQNARLQAAIKDHETARNALREAMTAIEHLTPQGQDNDPVSGQTPEQQRQQQEMRRQHKLQLAALSARVPELQANESELAAAVAEERNQWLLLNRRLDEIERGLAK